MSEFGYRPDIKKAVNLTGMQHLLVQHIIHFKHGHQPRSADWINILALGIPTIIEGQTYGKDVDLNCCQERR